jgi:PTS system cellobiose-specific IIA component
MEGLELICFELISYTGSARSYFIEAIQAAKKQDFEKATEYFAEGEKQHAEGHHTHAKLIQQEAAGQSLGVNLLLIHAEDQLMSCETIKIVADEMIQMYKLIHQGRLE